MSLNKTKAKVISRRAAICAFFMLLLFAGLEILSQEPTRIPPGNSRDEKAVNEAVQGWWPASMKDHDRRIAWWREAKFGCFMHWGVYSGFGGEWNGKPFRGYAEHMMRSQKIPLAVYKEQVVAKFNPVDFNADEWVRLIKAAGMKYLVITAKHHDGFAMYPSDVTRYNIRDATPFMRDPMRELADACRRNGIKFGFYYSHAFDWEHPDAPGNDWDYDNPGGDKKLHGGDRWYDEHPELLPKAQHYVDEKSIPQIKELIKKYHPDILWFDTPSKLPLSENLRILKAIRETDLNVVVNGRLARGAGYSFGDYKNTGDRAAELVRTEGDWETIPTTNESYGYHKYDLSHKPPAHFIQLLAKAAARGGNVLMNIGPMGNGRIDPKDQTILRDIGKWMDVNGASIYGTERTVLPVQAWGESTRRGNTIYLHVFDIPKDRKLVVGGLKSQIGNAYLLADAKKKPLKTSRLNDSDIAIDLPPGLLASPDTVIVIETKTPLAANEVRLLASHEHSNLLHVFDGDLYGKGLHYGDGKAARAYVLDWKDATQWVGWRVRLNEATEFDVAIKYTTPSKENRGSFVVNIGNQVLKGNVEPTKSEPEAAIVKIGRVKLTPGELEITVKPVEIKGGELMRLFYLELVPVEKGK